MTIDCEFLESFENHIQSRKAKAFVIDNLCFALPTTLSTIESQYNL